MALCSACSNTDRFDIPGAGEAFCVPHANIVNAPPWVDATMATSSGGFAFRGCGDSVGKNCAFPADLESGTVGPLNQFAGWSWKNFPDDAHYRDVTQQSIADQTYRLYPDTGSDSRILAVPLTGYRTATLFWRIAGTGDPRMTDDAELLASCEGVSPGGPGRDETAYQCSRSTRRDNVAISYSFQNGAITTQWVERLDQGVEYGLRHWRCH